MVEQIFLSPQVKGSVIVRNKLVLYELTHDLLKNLTLDFSKLGNIIKFYKPHRIIAQPLAPGRNENSASTSKKQKNLEKQKLYPPPLPPPGPAKLCPT